jgi:sec-independent protein translocase protein TatA
VRPGIRPIDNDIEEARMFSGLESPMHLLVVLVIAVLVLGPKKLPDAGRALGSGIRQFKDSIEGNEKKPD